MRHRVITTAMAVTLAASISACEGASINGDKPAPHSSWCFDRPCNQSSGVVATADAGPVPVETAESSGGGDCKFYYSPDSSGVAAADHTLIVATVKVKCAPLPRSLSVTISIHYLVPLGKHYETVGAGGENFPGPALTAPIMAVAPCEPGLYYLEMHANGYSRSNAPFSAHVIGTTVTVPAHLCV